jgi:hypothetical protein
LNRWSASETNRIVCGGLRTHGCVRGSSASLFCFGMASGGRGYLAESGPAREPTRIALLNSRVHRDLGGDLVMEDGASSGCPERLAHALSKEVHLR